MGRYNEALVRDHELILGGRNALSRVLATQQVGEACEWQLSLLANVLCDSAPEIGQPRRCAANDLIIVESPTPQHAQSRAYEYQTMLEEGFLQGRKFVCDFVC